MDILDKLLGLTHFGARWVLWLLVLFSIAALGVIIERAVLFLSSRDDAARLCAELRRLLRVNDLELARRRLEESPSYEARIAAAGLDARGAASAEERMQGETELCRLSMDRNLALLGTLGSNAPFVGLLGTVRGIVRALGTLSTPSAQVSAGLAGRAARRRRVQPVSAPEPRAYRPRRCARARDPGVHEGVAERGGVIALGRAKDRAGRSVATEIRYTCRFVVRP